MKIHLLSTFPGTNAGKTKDVDPRYHAEGIAAGWGVDAEDGSEHPDDFEEVTETEGEGDQKVEKKVRQRKKKTDKEADAILTK